MSRWSIELNSVAAAVAEGDTWRTTESGLGLGNTFNCVAVISRYRRSVVCSHAILCWCSLKDKEEKLQIIRWEGMDQKWDTFYVLSCSASTCTARKTETKNGEESNNWIKRQFCRFCQLTPFSVFSSSSQVEEEEEEDAVNCVLEALLCLGICLSLSVDGLLNLINSSSRRTAVVNSRSLKLSDLSSRRTRRLWMRRKNG